MYRLSMYYVDGTVIRTEFDVYTEAIVALCAAINAGQYEGVFDACRFEKIHVDEKGKKHYEKV